MTLDNERNWRPRVDALKGTAIYTALASGYILASSGIAARFATNTEELEHLEIWKGIGFVVVTAAILLVVLRAHEARIREQAAALARRDEHLATAGRRDLRVLEAATIAHDLNNALTVLDAEVRELIETPVPRPSDDMDQTLDQLRRLARGLGDTLHDRVAPDLENLDFGELATRVAHIRYSGKACQAQEFLRKSNA